jgi:uncharacterized protein YdaU (DUF1376 family)
MREKKYMPFYTGDYLRDTLHLSAMQHGAYILLIIHYWEHGGLPKTKKGRAQISRLPYNTYRDHELTLAAFFSQPGWRHKRIDAELARFEKIKQVKAMAGIKGGAKTAMAYANATKNGVAYARSRKAAYAAKYKEERKNPSLIESERTPKRVGDEASSGQGNGHSSLDASLMTLGDLVRKQGWLK